MSRRESDGPKKMRPVTGAGVGHSRTKIEDLSIEELCKRVNIQTNLLELQSEDEEKVRSALSTLSAVTRYTDRKDALYVLIGYYQTEIRTIDEIVNFFHGTRAAFSTDLSMMILKDLVRFKDLGSKQRIFVDDFLSHLGIVLAHSNGDRKNEIRTLIENSAWGDNKLKRKFLETLSSEF